MSGRLCGGTRAFRATLTLLMLVGVVCLWPLPAGADGEVPRWASEICTPRPRVPADFERVFQNRGPVWAGGDGAQVVTLDERRSLWLFGDTFVGSADPDGARGSDNEMVNNSLVLQVHGATQDCWIHLLRGGPGDWKSALPPIGDEEYSWPMQGVVDPATGLLHLTALRVRSVPAPVGGFGFEVLGIDLLDYRADTLAAVATRPSPVPYTSTGDGSIGFGSSVLVEHGNVYLYGCNTSYTSSTSSISGTGGCYVARSARSLDPATWEYWRDGLWASDWTMATAMPMEQPPVGQLTVVRAAGGYLASGQDDVLGAAVRVWFSEEPTGPWRASPPVGDAHTTSAGPLRAEWFSYGGRVVPLDGAGLTTVVNLNSYDDTAQQSTSFYGPRFLAPSLGPFGSLDAVRRVPGGVAVEGWAAVRESDRSVSIELRRGTGRYLASAHANRERPDIPTIHPDYSTRHGFSVRIPLRHGTHEVCARAHAQRLGDDTRLGCEKIGIDGRPFGALDRVTRTRSGVRAAGWAVDPDTAESIEVRVRVRRAGDETRTTADLRRSDVGIAHPGYGARHGFRTQIATARPRATLKVCAYAVTATGPDQSLGCRDVPPLRARKLEHQPLEQ